MRLSEGFVHTYVGANGVGATAGGGPSHGMLTHALYDMCALDTAGANSANPTFDLCLGHFRIQSSFECIRMQEQMGLEPQQEEDLLMRLSEGSVQIYAGANGVGATAGGGSPHGTPPLPPKAGQDRGEATAPEPHAPPVPQRQPARPPPPERCRPELPQHLGCHGEAAS